MIDWLYYLALAVCGVVSVWFFIDTGRSVRPGRPHLWAIAAQGTIFAALIAATAGNIIDAAGFNKMLYFSYLAVAIGVPFLGYAWGKIDRSRWGIGTLAVTPLISAALLFRCNQIWETQINVLIGQ